MGGGVGLALVVSLQLAWQPGWDGTAGGSDFDGAGVTVHVKIKNDDRMWVCHVAAAISTT